MVDRIYPCELGAMCRVLGSVFVFVFVFSMLAYGQSISFDARCFTSDGVNPVNVKLSTSYVSGGRLNFGYVHYEKSSEAILLSYVSMNEKVLAEDRPSEVTTIWKEVFKNKFGGEYRVVSQGANIYSFSYKSTTGKVTNFAYNHSAIMPEYTGCAWK